MPKIHGLQATRERMAAQGMACSSSTIVCLVDDLFKASLKPVMAPHCFNTTSPPFLSRTSSSEPGQQASKLVKKVFFLLAYMTTNTMGPFFHNLHFL